MHNFDINLENLTKMEGHANLDVSVKNGKVEFVKLNMPDTKIYLKA